MMDYHIVTPFTRKEYLDKIVSLYSAMGIIWHPVSYRNEYNVPSSRDWIKPYTIPEDKPSTSKSFNIGYRVKNYYINHAEIIDNDYYMILDDDDMIEADVPQKIKQMTEDVIFISMRRGYHVPKDVPVERQYKTSTLYADPSNISVGRVSQQQFIAKGSVFRATQYDEKVRYADCLVAIDLKGKYSCRYERNLFALFNFFETRRWDIPTKRINLLITTRCNRLCPSCCYNIPGLASREDYSIEYISHAARYLQGLDNLCLSGGEPSLYMAFGELVPRIKAMFACKQLSIETNGDGFLASPAAYKYFDIIYLSNYQRTSYPGSVDNSDTVDKIKKFIGNTRTKLHVFPIVHLQREKRKLPVPCYRETLGVLSYYNGKLYPCCTAHGMDGAQGIELTDTWKDDIRYVMRPCKNCLFAEEDTGNNA